MISWFASLVFAALVIAVVSSYVRTYLRRRKDCKRTLYLVKTKWGAVTAKPRHFDRLNKAKLVEDFETF